MSTNKYMKALSDKKFLRISEYGDRWTLLEGLFNGMPIITRYKSSLVDAIGHTDYPFQIGVAVPLLNPTDNGLPTSSEVEALLIIEDLLVAAIEEQELAVHVMTITFGNMREFVFYASEWKPESFERKVELVKNSISTQHELQFMMQEDRDWESYQKYLGKD